MSKKCINVTQFLCQYNKSFFTVWNNQLERGNKAHPKQEME